MRYALTLGLASLWSASAWAQIPSSEELLDRLRGGGVLLNFVMLEQPAVQKEINATPQQVQAAKDLAQQLRGGLQGLAQMPAREAAEKVAKTRDAAEAGLGRILTPSQLARLRQIGLQQAGPLIGLTNPDVAETLGLSAMQRGQLRDLQESLIAQVVNATPPSSSGLGRARATLQTLRELQAAKQQADAKALAVLAPEQATRWTQMQGAPFQGETQFNRLRDRLGRR